MVLQRVRDINAEIRIVGMMTDTENKMKRTKQFVVDEEQEVEPNFVAGGCPAHSLHLLTGDCMEYKEHTVENQDTLQSAMKNTKIREWIEMDLIDQNSMFYSFFPD